MPGVDLRLSGSEDCLNQNIWTPSLEADRKLPMVFISVNYRLGVLGGLYLADLLGEEYRDSGSNSVLDVLLAIRWVKANAAAFGGDPESITLMGISAGAKSIGALMTMERTDSLFSKAVLESGAVQALRSLPVEAAAGTSSALGRRSRSVPSRESRLPRSQSTPAAKQKKRERGLF